MIAKHPYKQLPPQNYWKAMVAEPLPADVDPVVAGKFRIRRHERIATAGSCFAQHIARHLHSNGFNFFVTEHCHPIAPSATASAFNYGVYPARFGNIYTAEQLLQTLRRAYGIFQPLEDVWSDSDGGLIDPFRPQIQPGGFASDPEYLADRRQHFLAIREMIGKMDVFVFTLGLTEAWRSKKDGAVYPVCPGVSGGVFDGSRHEFHNFSVSEVVDSLQKALDFIQIRNPDVKIILTVSPVPLVATMEPEGVLQATAYSKAVLRVACHELTERIENVAYFPSYEVITGSFNRGAYFGANLRDVTESGVSHVMRLFAKHYLDDAQQAKSDSANPVDEHTAQMEKIVKVVCEEESLSP